MNRPGAHERSPERERRVAEPYAARRPTGRLRFRLGLERSPERERRVFALRIVPGAFILLAMSGPLAHFITWSCYSNWLHGDERGSVDREHNISNTPYLDPDPSRKRREADRSRQPPFKLDAAARQVVADVIAAHCRHRGWELLALNVRTNHVHVVVAGVADPDRALVEFKAWATRRLREAGLISTERRVWTDHGSTRYLWKPEDVAEKVHYVADCQGPDLE